MVIKSFRVNRQIDTGFITDADQTELGLSFEIVDVSEGGSAFITVEGIEENIAAWAARSGDDIIEITE